MNKISLHGFNHLTKSLGFSLYKLSYFQDISSYQTFINNQFNANNLQDLLANLCDEIGGTILNIAKQDYQPQGASVTLMISEEAEPASSSITKPQSHIAHLDKSHLCIHTYPDDAPQANLAIFRADIELSTCGVISPLKVMNKVIETFNADVVDIDYRVRGMTRDQHGKKLFNIDYINQLSECFSPELKENYKFTEHISLERNLFHTKLARKKVILDNYLFDVSKNDFSQEQQKEISKAIIAEIEQLFTNTC